MTDIFMGHNTWNVYSSMLRIFKRYDFNFQNPLVNAKSMTFSSYPGTLSSWDDYYVMNSKFVV